MSKQNLRSITNSFQDVRLASLASWKQAGEINPRDRGGPYVVLQEGFDPEDLNVAPDEFVLGRSGKWLSIALFYKLPIAERRAEFIFGTAAEVMRVMSNLPPKASVIRPGAPGEESEVPGEPDEMAEALKAGLKPASGSAVADPGKPPA